MTKVRKNFKLSQEACLSLVRLSGLWACDQTAVVERLLAEADPSEMDREERDSTQAALEDASQPALKRVEQPLETARGTGSVKRQVAIPKPAWKGAAPVTNGVIDREKNLAFQRQLGMDSAKARK